MSVLDRTDTDVCMYLVRNTCLRATNDVYKCADLHSSSLECCYYYLKGLLVIVLALLGL